MTMQRAIPRSASEAVVFDDPMAFRCRQMWSEVLRMNLVEVCDSITRERRRAAKTRKAIPECPEPAATEPRVTWIGSEGFRIVCWLAGVDPSAVAWRARRDLATAEGTAAMRRRLSCFDREHAARGRRHAG